MRRRSPRALVVTTIIVGLLLHAAAFAAAAATRRARAAELAMRPPVDAALALPSNRLLDLVKPDRVPRLSVARHAAAPLRASGTVGREPRLARTAPPRARSHAARVRQRAPDDPPQPSVLA